MPLRATYLLALIFIPLVVGCDGCRRAADNGEDGEDKNAPREAYTAAASLAFPADRNLANGAVKPGHWVTASQSLRSNKADVRGEMRSMATMRVIDDEFQQVGVVQTGVSSRPVVLPKGQMRRFDYRVRVPIPISVAQSRVSLSSQLVPRSGGIFDSGQVPFSVMKNTEFFFVVLTDRPQQFAKLQTADWVQSTRVEFSDNTDVNYRMVFPKTDDLVPLPETMLDMTSTAVILWDNVSEDTLTPLQQTAVRDWVQFGGRLIVNGPRAAEAIANTKLQSLLALTPTGNIELDHDAAEELMTKWKVKSDESISKQVEFLRSESSRIAIDGRLHPDAEAVENTGSLIVKRRVGRGHIVQPRFDITEPWIDSWDSYQSFVNGVILNRPARRIIQEDNGAGAASFQDFSRNRAGDDVDTEDLEEDMMDLGLTQKFVNSAARTDAAVNTQFRLASRDMALIGTDSNAGKRTSEFDRFTRVDPMTGISAWKDTSDTMQAFQATLSDEAGIEIPGSSLVVRSLAIYLIVLVPVNYLIFWFIGRLEYAWLAVPVIAIVGAAWAAHQARLDIGFATSNTELALVEAHAGYPRGHVSRLIAVYNSLAGTYRVQFKTVDGAAATLDKESNRESLSETAFQTSYEEGPALVNFGVPSNRLRFLHTEEVLDLGGAITYNQNGIVNDTDLELLDAAVVHKTTDGDFQAALVGGIEPGEQVPVQLRSVSTPDIPSALPMGLSPILRQFASSSALPRGATRLIARLDGSMPGLTITPDAKQRAAQTVVMVHLDYTSLPEPQIDQNLRGDFRRVRRDRAKTSDE